MFLFSVIWYFFTAVDLYYLFSLLVTFLSNLILFLCDRYTLLLLEEEHDCGILGVAFSKRWQTSSCEGTHKIERADGVVFVSLKLFMHNKQWSRLNTDGTAVTGSLFRPKYHGFTLQLYMKLIFFIMLPDRFGLSDDGFDQQLYFESTVFCWS